MSYEKKAKKSNAGSRKSYKKSSENILVKGRDYIVISELPNIERQFFEAWLIGQTMPVIEQEKDKYGCAYKWDYEKFKEAYDKGKIAPVTD